MTAATRAPRVQRAPLTRRLGVAAAVTGFGLGAFADGIVLHQVLQWHHLVSEQVPADDLDGLRTNTLADGLFHATCWLVTVLGLVLLWRALRRDGRPPGRALAGVVLVGWGLFHVVDQMLFHLALDAHHIRMVDDYAVYDWGYTAVGVALAAVGAWLVRSSHPPEEAP